MTTPPLPLAALEPPAPPPLVSSAAAKVFHFEYEGAPRPLKPYLLERYGFGRGADWREHFFPPRVRLNGAPVDEATVVRPGDRIAYLHQRTDEPAPAEPLAVLYEDEWMRVLHKPDSYPVSPSGIYYFTSLAVRAREESGNPELTPIHRLDLETDGPLIFARRARDLKRLHTLFTRKTLRKTYRALVYGAFPEEIREIAGRIVPDEGSAILTKLRLAPGTAQDSLTRVLRVTRHETPRGPCSELELEPVTGKTNQIRVHLAHVGHAIVGDKKYHPDEGVFLDWLAHRDFARLRERLWLPRQALHCAALEMEHPFTGAALRIEALPGSWADKVSALVEPGHEAPL